MLKKRMEAAETIAAAIRSTEISIDVAATEAQRLVTVLYEQRAKSGVDMSVGLDAISSASRAANLATEARRAMIEAHLHLTPALKQTGLTRMFGKEELPPNEPSEAQRFFVGA
jgi:D-alanyl-D-alanine dipeptidase